MFWITERGRWPQNIIQCKPPSSSPTVGSPFCPWLQKHHQQPCYLQWVLPSRFSVAEDTLSCCQAFPQLILAGLMALCGLVRLTGNWKERVLKDTSLLCSAASSSSLFSEYFTSQTDVFIFCLLTKRKTRGISEAKINKRLFLFSRSRSAFTRVLKCIQMKSVYF